MTINIDMKLCNLLRKFDFEIAGCKQLTCWLMSHVDFDIPNDWRDQKLTDLQQTLQARIAEKEMLLDVIRKKYIPEDYRNAKYTMNIDYGTGEVSVVDSSCPA